LNISPSAINNTAGSTIVDVTQASYYIFSISSIDIRVDIQCDPNQDTIQLHFMNAYGMFDTARFKCANRLMMNINRKSFERKDVVFDNDKVRFGKGRTFNERKINFDGVIGYSYKLTMDFITDAEYEWLSELIYSPQVYLCNTENGYLYPVTIKNTDYEFVKHRYDQLRSLQIDIELNQNKNTFRR
jgi:hypothetical protein